MSYDIHSIVMTMLGALFHTHVRPGYTVMCDIHCVLDDAHGESRRAPDVVIAHQVVNPKGEAHRGIPIIAVEVRGAQSKKYIEEKVKLFIEHDWPTVWIVHAERGEVEVVQKGLAPVVYRKGANVPLVPELDRYGLSSMPVTAFFDQVEARRYIQEWVHLHGDTIGRLRERAQSLLDVLVGRGLDIPAHVRERISSCTDLDKLQRWFTLALTSTNTAEFVKVMD